MTLWLLTLTLGCSVAYKHAVFIFRCHKYYSTKLIATSLVDKLYDFESNHVLNLISLKRFVSDGNVVYVFVE